DFVLGRVDVLVFVHEYKAKLLAPLERNRSWLAGARAPKKSKGVLFEVVKVHHARFTFGLGKGLFELAGEFEQSRHLQTNPGPIFGQGVCLNRSVGLDAKTGEEKIEFREEFLERVEPSPD